MLYFHILNTVADIFPCQSSEVLSLSNCSVFLAEFYLASYHFCIPFSLSLWVTSLSFFSTKLFLLLIPFPLSSLISPISCLPIAHCFPVLRLPNNVHRCSKSLLIRLLHCSTLPLVQCDHIRNHHFTFNNTLNPPSVSSQYSTSQYHITTQSIPCQCIPFPNNPHHGSPSFPFLSHHITHHFLYEHFSRSKPFKSSLYCAPPSPIPPSPQALLARLPRDGQALAGDEAARTDLPLKAEHGILKRC